MFAAMLLASPIGRLSLVSSFLGAFHGVYNSLTLFPSEAPPFAPNPPYLSPPLRKNPSLPSRASLNRVQLSYKILVRSPNAPQIPYSLHFAEKANFAGILIGAIFYGMSTHSVGSSGLILSARSIAPGIVIGMLFQSMEALFSPCHRTRGGVRWGLVAYTVTTLSFVTIFTAMNLDIQSISYIDNREFPGNDALPPGPLGYQYLIYSKALVSFPISCSS